MEPTMPPRISDQLTANGIRSQHTESPGTRARAKRGSVCFAGNLLGSGDYFVKFGRTLLVFGEYDVDLGVGGNRNDHATVGIEAHDFGIARGADVLGQPLPQHIVFGKGGT